MIRQAINCDMCGAEKLGSTSHWFVADEQKGELRLRLWDSSAKGTRKNMKHLCGQKCVQRLMDNFTASMVAGLQGSRIGKEAIPEGRGRSVADRDEVPVLERMGYDRETVALIEADSWAGPVRPTEKTWGAENSSKSEGLVDAMRAKAQTARGFQRSA